MARRYRFRIRSRRQRRKPSILSSRRKKKNVRHYNRGKLRIQRAMQYGGSLPKETSARIFWRGSGVINMCNHVPQGVPLSSFGPNDQQFCMDELNGPYCTPNASMVTPTGLRGTASYATQWAAIYQQAVVTGSKLRITIRNPLYPSQISTVISTEDRTAETGAVPPNLMYGFYYLRYHYARWNPQNATGFTTVIGQPTWSVPNWKNMRDFMIDPTVQWVRDRLPRATKLSYSNAIEDDTSDTKNLFPNSGVNARVQYEVEYSNRPITLTASFSRRKHFGQGPDDYPWKASSRLLPAQAPPVPQADPPTTSSPHMYVTIGYVGFTADGSVCVNSPADRIPNKQIEAVWVARIRLRNPQWEAFSSTARAGTVVPTGIDIPIDELELEHEANIPDFDVEDSESEDIE